MALLAPRSARPAPEAAALPRYFFLVRSLRNLVVYFTAEGHLDWEESSHNDHNLHTEWPPCGAELAQLPDF